ncbi:hypothetical protein DENSPDRAFT_838560 [Dentipellis sp. KUC8613]|nr:hypothetical protein DENSPDRAFT_838560 [Dentipellis sp. KUC8613]
MFSVPRTHREAVAAFERALKITTNEQDVFPTRAKLAEAYFFLWQVDGDIQDLERSCGYFRSLTSGIHPHRTPPPGPTGLLLPQRTILRQARQDIRDTISSLIEALRPMYRNTARRLSWCCNISSALSTRFDIFGDIIDMDEAIAMMRGVIDSVHDLEEDTQIYSQLQTLGNFFLKLSEHSQNILDINRAIACYRRASETTQDFSNLGVALCYRYHHRKDPEDFKKARLYITNTIGSTPNGRSADALGTCFYVRYKLNKDPSDLDQCIQHHALAELLSSREVSAPGKVLPQILLHLGRALVQRFSGTADKPIADINRAVSACVRAASLLPKYHPDQTQYLIGHAQALTERYKHSRVRGDIEKALSNFRIAALLPSGRPIHRYLASRMWKNIAYQQMFFESSLEGCRAMMDLVPLVVWLGLTIQQRYQEIKSFGGDVRSAAAIALFQDRPELALQWLEQSRSIVWQQQLNLRVPLEDIGKENPDLAQGLSDVARALDCTSTRRLFLDEDSEAQIEQKQRLLAVRWKELTSQVREVRGFKNFLVPSDLQELQKATRSGTVVVLVATRSYCWVLFLRKESDVIRSEKIRSFSQDKAKKLQDALKSILRVPSLRARSSMPRLDLRKGSGLGDILSNLWVGLVQPIVQLLGFQVHKSRKLLPRIIWCPTGQLAFLPLHAAGLYGQRSAKHNISSYAVSSYTTTVTALMQDPPPMTSTINSLLTVSQPDTPNHNALPETEVEIQKIRDCAPHVGMKWLNRETATVENVRSEISRNNWIHLACHATQDSSDPLRSAFLLHDGNLELGDIIQQSRPQAEFAFLSACQTFTGDEKLPDEAVHLAAGMQMAGYRSIVATMWSIKDSDGPAVAREFYTRMFAEPHGRRPDCTRAAQALHGAVNFLRDATWPEKGVTDEWLLRWVPFIHLGI